MIYQDVPECENEKRLYKKYGLWLVQMCLTVLKSSPKKETLCVAVTQSHVLLSFSFPFSQPVTLTCSTMRQKPLHKCRLNKRLFGYLRTGSLSLELPGSWNLAYVVLNSLFSFLRPHRSNFYNLSIVNTFLRIFFSIISWPKKIKSLPRLGSNWRFCILHIDEG